MSLIGRKITVRQKVGLIIMVFLCGMPGMELAGFGFGLNLTFSTCLICAVTGGAIGGLLYCSKPFMAGLGGRYSRRCRKSYGSIFLYHAQTLGMEF